MQLLSKFKKRHDKLVFISAGVTAFLVLRVFFVILDNPQPTLNHAICSAYSPNVVETKIHGQCYG